MKPDLALSSSPTHTNNVYASSNGIDGSAVLIPVVAAPKRATAEHGESRPIPVLTVPSSLSVEKNTVKSEPDMISQTPDENMFRLLFDKNPVPMWVFHDETKRFLHVNEAAIKRYGYSAQQFVEKTIFDLCAPEERGRLARWFESRSRNMGGTTGYWRHQTADGELLWVEIFRQNIVFGGQASCLTTATDVTEQVRGWEERLAFQEALLASEEAARRNAENLLHILEEMADGFFTLDSEWRVTFVNQQAERLLGRSRDTLIGKTLWEELPELVGSVYEEQYRKAALEGNPTIFQEQMLEETRWFEIHAYPISGGDSHPSVIPSGAMLSVTLRDIQDQKTAVAEQERRQQERIQAARQQRRMLKEMLGSVTQGKLRFCEDSNDLPAAMTQWSSPIPLKTSAALATLRQKVRDAAQACGFSPDRSHGLVSGAGEAAINALLYGDAQGNTQGRISVSSDLSRIQVWIEDSGQGIPLDLLPRETLSRGQGFSIMLDSVDTVHLLTGSSGTTVVLEMLRNPPDSEPYWLNSVPAA